MVKIGTDNDINQTSMPNILRELFSEGLVKSGEYDGMTLYRVVLAANIGAFRQGEVIPRVEISWFSGEIRFLDIKKTVIGSFSVILRLQG
jgi:hypothetical protein